MLRPWGDPALTKAAYDGAHSQVFFCGSGLQSGQPNTPPDNTAYEGLVVRTPWRYPTKTDVATAAHAVKAGQCPDGLSNTLLVAEKHVRSDLYNGGAWFDDWGWADGWDPDQVRSTAFQPMNDADVLCFGGATGFSPFCGRNSLGEGDVWHFGSAHPTGINAVFGDGSVRPIAYTVDVILFNRLGGRNDEEHVDVSQL